MFLAFRLLKLCKISDINSWKILQPKLAYSKKSYSSNSFNIWVEHPQLFTLNLISSVLNPTPAVICPYWHLPELSTYHLDEKNFKIYILIRFVFTNYFSFFLFTGTIIWTTWMSDLLACESTRFNKVKFAPASFDKMFKWPTFPWGFRLRTPSSNPTHGLNKCGCKWNSSKQTCLLPSAHSRSLDYTYFRLYLNEKKQTNFVS